MENEVERRKARRLAERIRNEEEWRDDEKGFLITVSAWLKYYEIQKRKKASVPRPIIPRRTPFANGYERMEKILAEDPREFRSLYRMYPDVFKKLATIIREKVRVRDTRYICVEEMLAISMRTVGQNNRYSVTRKEFERSRWVISMSFNTILNALVVLTKDWLVKPSTTVEPKVFEDDRFYPFFKDCIGALDGTHIPALVATEDAVRYRNRHGITSQNVLAACNFDMEFTYVNCGWEGSAHDSRILNDALMRKAFTVPNGKFYLVDCGFANRRSFLAPFRGVKYHLQEYDGVGQEPQNGRELFNLRHASLRNVIERIFGVFKSRFAIFQIRPPYSIKTQTKLVFACAGLHNFLRKECRTDEFPIPPEVERAQANQVRIDHEANVVVLTQEQQREEANTWRDEIVNEMWEHELRVRALRANRANEQN